MKHHNALVHGNRLKDMETTLALNYLALDGLKLNLLDAFTQMQKVAIRTDNHHCLQECNSTFCESRQNQFAAVHRIIGCLSRDITPAPSYLFLSLMFYK